MIYLDNASTSFPKPPAVIAGVTDYLKNFAVSPSRGSHLLAKHAESIVTDTRQLIANLLGVANRSHIVMCSNATHALNIVIKGALSQQDHVLICNYSHNSVLRPIESLARKKIIKYDVFNIDAFGKVNVHSIESKIKPNTKMLILNCASNVIGVKAPVKLISEICKRHNILLLLDVTQAILYDEINNASLQADFIAGTGHKSLLGPTGSGFLYVRDPNIVSPLIEGGSGGISSVSPVHPQILPHKFEAGTLNMLAIAGLHAGLLYITKIGAQKIAQHTMELTRYLWQNLQDIPEITLYGSNDFTSKVPVVSFTIDLLLATEAAFIYEKKYEICIRAGIQCAPLLHRLIGTFPVGTIRASPGAFNTKEDIDQFVLATKQIIYEVTHGKTGTG